MLPDGKIVNKVVQELINFGTKSIMIDMSSSDPNDTLNLGNELSKKNIEFIDAPVSGGVARAITGKLIIMVGGNEVTISKVDKILNAISEFLEYVSPSLKYPYEDPWAGNAGHANVKCSFSFIPNPTPYICSFDSILNLHKYDNLFIDGPR